MQNITSSDPFARRKTRNDLLLKSSFVSRCSDAECKKSHGLLATFLDIIMSPDSKLSRPTELESFPFD